MIIPNSEIIIDGIKNGQYNLLVGSGVTADSLNSNRMQLGTGRVLKEDLAKLYGLPNDTPLNMLYRLLKSDEIETYITNRYINTIPSESIKMLPKYLWRRIYTFNIDDVIENLYMATQDRMQSLEVINYSDPFKISADIASLQIVHLHGYVRRASDGYVFSTFDYNDIIHTNNVWMHTLAEIIPSEPFIIAGASMNEPDLSYYLSYRNSRSARKGLAPSLYIEPNPTIINERQCEENDLILVKSTFEEFLEHIHSLIPYPPSIYSLSVKTNKIFAGIEISKDQVTRFYRDFEDYKMLEPSDRKECEESSSFILGYEPSYLDIAAGLDVSREVTIASYQEIIQRYKQKYSKVLILNGQYYNGKSTSAMRCLYEASKAGYPVIVCRRKDLIDVNNTIECLSKIDRKVIIFFEDIAEMIDSAYVIFKKCNQKVLILGTERKYRIKHIQNVLGDQFDILENDKLTKRNVKELIDRYIGYGYVASEEVLRNVYNFINEYYKKPIGMIVCTILNDYAPIDLSIPKLIGEIDDVRLRLFIIAGLAAFIGRDGIRYSMLQMLAGRNYSIDELFVYDNTFRLTINTRNSDFVRPMNQLLMDRCIVYLSEKRIDFVQSCYIELVTLLSHRVSRESMKQRTYEARLAGKLLDYDDTVKRFFGKNSIGFYSSIQKNWEWNSRFWEQFALMSADRNLDKAIKYARQAVAIDNNIFPLTTLGTVLLQKSRKLRGMEAYLVFEEALSNLFRAFSLEERLGRSMVYPSRKIINGTHEYILLHGETLIKRELVYSLLAIVSQINESKILFGSDANKGKILEKRLISLKD